ncbi:MAG TPA: P1 family peptidase, partial [Verrucomicrobiae bacterium]|nr:P1 family peptidase [Verrucomicrobiae bacterium]
MRLKFKTTRPERHTAVLPVVWGENPPRSVRVSGHSLSILYRRRRFCDNLRFMQICRKLPSPLLAALFGLTVSTFAQSTPRARDLGVPFDGTPGTLDAITDVRGVEVGDTTLISGSGPLKVGQGPVRTGVTVIFPRGKADPDPVYAGWFAQNGNGEMTGTTWVEESGFLESPIAITNTHSVGVVRDAIIAWGVKH